MKEIRYDEDGYIIAGSKRYTNKHGLSDEIVKAILTDRYTTEGEEPSDFSASRMISPTQAVVLEKNYPEKMKIFDVVDDFYSFLGSIGHQVLEEAHNEDESGGTVEKRLYMDIMNHVLSGKMDHYKNGKISDYKTCKVYKIMKGDYSDWEKQQNIYAQLCRENKWIVEEIEITVLITDWKKHEIYKDNYPKCPIITIPIRLWEEKEAMSYINLRASMMIEAQKVVDEHQAANNANPCGDLSTLFPCTDAERWKDLKDWAVMKNDADPSGRATASCATEQEAEQKIGEKGWHATHKVVKRMTDATRCKDWCPASTICAQWAKENDDGVDRSTLIF